MAIMNMTTEKPNITCASVSLGEKHIEQPMYPIVSPLTLSEADMDVHANRKYGEETA